MCFTCLLYAGLFLFFFFFNDTATTEIYTLSLHDALPIFGSFFQRVGRSSTSAGFSESLPTATSQRSEEHTSELQSQSNLVCRLLLEKKKKTLQPISPDLRFPRPLAPAPCNPALSAPSQSP